MNILAAQFDEFTQTDAAVEELCGMRGFARTDVAKVVLGAPGRHDAFAIGGDEDEDAGASRREQALAVFTHHRARGIEEAEGQWSNGSWADFNPVSRPHWLLPPAPLTDALATSEPGADAS